MNFEIENLYSTINKELSSRDKLIEFANSFFKDGIHGLNAIALLPIVNALKKHPEWLKGIFELSISHHIKSVLLHACVVLLYEGNISPYNAIKTLELYDGFYHKEDVSLFCKVILKTENSYIPDSIAVLYEKIFKHYGDVCRRYMPPNISKPDMCKFIIRDFHLLTNDILKEMLYTFNVDSFFRDDFFDCLKNSDKKTVSYLLARFIPVITEGTSLSYYWELIYNLISSVLKNDLSLLIENLKKSNGVLFGNTIHVRLWNYLTDISSTIRIDSKDDFSEVAQIIPFIPEDKFLEIVAQCNSKTHSSTFLLNNVAITKNKKKFISILKTYLNALYISKNKAISPTIPITQDILHELSLQQITKLAKLSLDIKFTPKPIRFTYSQDALYEIKKILTTATIIGLCKPNIMTSFFKAHSSTSSEVISSIVDTTPEN